MNSKKNLLAGYVLQSKWFSNGLEGFTDMQTNKRIHPMMNHVKYLAGHLLSAQYGYAQIAGVSVVKKWEELFAPQGKSKAMDDYPYPTLEEIKADWVKLYEVVQPGLEDLPDESLQLELDYSPVGGFGILDNTLGDLWTFLNMHQAYHLGQIGILRRGFGLAPMAFF